MERKPIWRPDPITVFAPVTLSSEDAERISADVWDAFDYAMGSFINRLTEIDPRLTIEC